MYRIRICTISYDDKYKFFSQELESRKHSWPVGKYTYRFEELSVSYVNGGTHVITTNDDEVYISITKQLKLMLSKNEWKDYKMVVDNVSG